MFLSSAHNVHQDEHIDETHTGHWAPLWVLDYSGDENKYSPHPLGHFIQQDGREKGN